MQVHDVASRVAVTGEYILGAEATGSHACYLVYGVLAPGQSGRVFRPGAGHEELILCIEGELLLSGALDGMLRQGQAVHLRGDETCSAGNEGPRRAVYVIAGGHDGGAHGHGGHTQDTGT